VYWSVDQLNENPEGFSGAVVELSDGMNSVIFDEVAVNQEDISSYSFMASAGKIYSLTLSYHARSDTAYAIMTGVSPLEPFETNGFREYFGIISIQLHRRICLNYITVGHQTRNIVIIRCLVKLGKFIITLVILMWKRSLHLTNRCYFRITPG
jgi:hypothetical protein